MKEESTNVISVKVPSLIEPPLLNIENQLTAFYIDKLLETKDTGDGKPFEDKILRMISFLFCPNQCLLKSACS